MKDFLLALLHLIIVSAKLCGPGGLRAVIAENLVLKQQLIVLRRARRRAPNLTLSDRLLHRRLFSSTPCPTKRGPTGPDEALPRAIVELTSRNPRFGCPQIARLVSQTFGMALDKNVVYPVDGE